MPVLDTHALGSSANQAERSVVQVEDAIIRLLASLRLQTQQQKAKPNVDVVIENGLPISAYTETEPDQSIEVYVVETDPAIEHSALPGQEYGVLPYSEVEQLAGRDDPLLIEGEEPPLLPGNTPPLLPQGSPQLNPSPSDAAVPLLEEQTDVESTPLRLTSDPIVEIQIGETVIKEPLSNLPIALKQLPPEQIQELTDAVLAPDRIAKSVETATLPLEVPGTQAQTSETKEQVQIGEPAIEAPLTALPTAPAQLPHEQTQDLSDPALLTAEPATSVETISLPPLETRTQTQTSETDNHHYHPIQIKVDDEVKFNRTEDGVVHQDDFAPFVQQPKLQLQARPPAEVEVTTGQQVGTDSSTHREVITQAPTVIVARDDLGREFVSTSVQSNVGATEEEVEITEDDRRLFEGLQPVFQYKQEGIEVEGDTPLTILPQAEGFRAETSTGEVFDWDGKSARSTFSKENLDLLKDVASGVSERFAEFQQARQHEAENEYVLER